MAYDLGKATGVIELEYDGKDLKNVSKDLGETEGAAGKLGGGLKKLAGIAAAAFAAMQVGSFLKDSIGAAADLEQSVGAVDAIFKESAGQIHAWADTAATDLGLTANEYNELATIMGAQLKNGGTSIDELGAKTNDLMILGADLASTFGGSTSDAVSALSSALKGERDPIEKYGISLTQAAIDAKAAELGFKKVGGSLDANAQQAATLALILDQSADAQGNFGRESGTLANRLQVMSAQWGNLKSSIGTLFLPMMTAAATVITNTVMPAIQGFIDGVSSINSEMTPVDIVAALGIDPNGAFGTALSEVIGGVRAFIFAFQAGGDDITSSGFAGALEGLGLKARAAWDVLKSVFTEVKGGFTAFFAAFSEGGSDVTSSGLAGAMEQIGLVARELWDNFQQLEGSQLVGLLAGIAGAFVALVGPGTVFGGIVSKLTGGLGPLSSIISKIGPLFRLLTGPVGLIIGLLTTLYITNDEFRESMNGLFGVIGELVGTLLGALVPVFTQLATTLLPVIAGLFTALVPVIGSLLSAIVPIIAMLLGSLIPVLIQLITAVVPIIMQLIAAIVPIIVLLVTAIAGIIQALLPLIMLIIGQMIPIIQMLIPIIVTVLGVIVNVITAALGIIQGIISVVMGIISGNWSMVWEGIKQIFVGIWNTLVAILTGVVQIIWSVITNVLTAIFNRWTSVWNSVSTFFTNLWNSIWTFIVSIFSRIVNWIVTSVTNIKNGITNGFNAAKNAITNALNAARNTVINVFSRIVSAITTAVSNVKSRVQEGFNNAKRMAINAVTDMKTGVTNKFNEIVGFVKGIPGKIKSALGNLGTLLLNAGRDLMNGLRDGINEAWEGVKDRLSGITDMIPDWKGPPEKDATLLLNAGHLVMQGFDDGLKDSIPMVKKTLQGLTGALPGMVDLNPGKLGIDLNPNTTRPAASSSMYNGTGARSEELKLLATLADRLMEVGKTEVTLPVDPGEDRNLTGRRISEVLDLRAIALKGSGVL